MNPKKPIPPAIFLILFCIAESFLKSSVQNSTVQHTALLIFLVCLCYFVYYFRKHDTWSSFLEPSPSAKWETAILIGIIIIGTVFRFWKLSTLFDGMAWDEAYKGLDALAIRKFGERPVFLNWNAGREALIAYLVAASQQFFDYSIVSVRVVLAFSGCLTLVFFYLFLKTIFNTNTALLSTFLLSISKWHLIHTRLGIRVALIVLFEVAVLYLLAKGFRSKQNSLKWFIAAGFVGGLGLYTYIAYRAFPLVVLAFLIEKSVRAHVRTHVKPIAAGLIAAFLVTAPMAKFYWENRVSFTDRMQRTAVWRTRGTNLSAAELIADSTVKTAGLFTYEGDHVSRSNVNQEPMLSVFASSFFILGILITLSNLKKPYAFFLLIYLLVTLLPGMLSVNAPHSSRTIGVVVPAMLFTAFGILAAWKIMQGISTLLATTLLAIVLGGNFYTGPNDGLLRYGAALDSLDHKTSSLWGSDRDEFRVAQLLNQLGNQYDVYLSPQLFFHSAVEYLTYSKSEHNLFSFETNLQNSWKEQKIPLIVLQHQETNLWWLRDDEGKQFFKWWAQARGFKVERIHSIITRAYISNAKMTRMTDFRLIQHIKKAYPQARQLNLGAFTVFVIGAKK